MLFSSCFKISIVFSFVFLLFRGVIICFLCFHSFTGRLFQHALEDSRPKSVLVHSLSVCVSLLDPKRLTLGTYHMYSRQLTQGSTISANPETVEGMLGSLGKEIYTILSSSCSSMPLSPFKIKFPFHVSSEISVISKFSCAWLFLGMVYIISESSSGFSKNKTVFCLWYMGYIMLCLKILF